MTTFKQYFVEKSILGLEETIYIDGIGQIAAKLDTGNGAFNVLHGTDIVQDGEMVRFTTDNGMVLEKPISDHITINVGAGNTEDRPVVLLNVKVGSRVFKDIPFSIGNRSDNTHKVLISKTFIQNELDALIDVSLVDVAGKNMEVDV
tara:strand:+ start:7054 stop:7494 length:441 start_codon:yes stop_codon:yes gene_type:complete